MQFDANLMQSLMWAAMGCGFTWLMTTAGSAMVFFFRKDRATTHRIFLGFAAGVMIAASVWSLLNPAIEQAEELGQVGWIPAAGGFLLGVAFLLALDTFLPHLHAEEDQPEGIQTSWKRTTLLVSAVTLHNIPEGMSVGLLFAMAGLERKRRRIWGWPLRWLSAWACKTSPRERRFRCRCVVKE
jgi:ZIP family zinc transporter